MTASATFLGALSGSAFGAGSSVSWWQTLGGLIVVFGLLLISLKMLNKWNRRTAGNDSSFLTVWHLGPKKEIQVLRLEDQVHFIYRHDGSMVVLQTQTLGDFENKHGQLRTGQANVPWREALTRNLPFWNGSSKSPSKNPGSPVTVKERAALG